MSELISRATPVKTLAEWPLAKVELVTIDGKQFILKTVHPDFYDEILRQQCLTETLQSPLFTPSIIEVTTAQERPSFLMDYIEGTEPTEDQMLKALADFHSQTQGLHANTPFEQYTHKHFNADLRHVKEFLPDIPPTRFGEIFALPTSVVHGDWKSGQAILSDQKICILDFGKSFYGPSILDYAYYFKGQASAGPGKTPHHRSLLLRAKVVVHVMQMCWFIRCRDHYIQYDYVSEITQTREAIAEVVSLLAS